MCAFWRFLLRKNLPADSLSGLSFAAFGLGDSGKSLLLRSSISVQNGMAKVKHWRQ